MTERAYAEKVHPDHWTADMYQVLISQVGCAFERGQMTHYECWKIIHDFYMQTHATMNQEEIDVISYYVTCLDSMLLFLGRGGYAARRKAPAFQGIPARDSVVHHRLQQAQLRNSPALIQELQNRRGRKAVGD